MSKIKIGDKVRVKKDLPEKQDWLCIPPEEVEKVSHQGFLTVTAFSIHGNLIVSENVYTWPIDYFEPLPEEEVDPEIPISEKEADLEVLKEILTDEDKEFLRKLLQSQIDTCTGLIAKLK